uniref:Uncharacterized protein n=1 Tax=Oryza barthii TaxID=65489 RepID=A0A0D3GY52_9ORYZ
MAGVVGLLAMAVVREAGAKLGAAIGEQVMMLCGFKEDLEDMKDMLESMAAVLKDAERRSVTEESVLLWLKRLKNAAYDISDMLDEFQDKSKSATAGKMKTMLSCFAIASKISMANKMKKMRDQLRKIKEGHEAFRLTPDSTPYNEHHRPDPRETTSKVIQSSIIGRDKERKQVVSLLSASDEEDTVIVPIYGFGGIGKTALAQLVFNDTQFRGYDHRVWVYVSQVFDLKKIGDTIISQVSNERNKNEYTRENINGRLCDLLEDKNTLIVLDDLWETNDFHLNELKLMLNTKGKIKVLVTTRNEDVAKKICTHKPYVGLCHQRSNFEARGDKDQIEQVGWVIAKKCGGIALAAHALGFLLSGMDLVEWRALSNSDIWTEAFSDNSVLPSLKLTYKNMPPYLRLCFAYCAIFPKGHNIAKASLVHQWIALGFIEPSKTFSSVRLGEKSLPHSIELIDSLEFLIVVGCSDQLKEYLRKSQFKNIPISLPHFIVHSISGDSRSNLHMLEDINPVRLEISCLENVKSIEEARGIELSEKQNLSTLTFHWTSWADRLLEDKDVLGELMPPRGLWNLSIQGYDSTTFPTWFVGISHHLPSLVKIELKDLHRCRHLPPLGQLPNLNELEEWSTTTHSKGGEDSIEFMFPMLVTLSIELCPMLRLKPCPPMFHSWLISESDKVISSWGEIRHEPAASFSHSFSSSSDTNLEIKGVGVAADEWRLLHHLPTLQQLEISWCKNLLHLPDAIRHLPSLWSLSLNSCEAIQALPEWLCEMTSLQIIRIWGCEGIKSLPHHLFATDASAMDICLLCARQI